MAQLWLWLSVVVLAGVVCGTHSQLVNEKVFMESAVIGPTIRHKYDVAMRNDGRGSFYAIDVAVPPPIADRARVSVLVEEGGKVKTLFIDAKDPDADTPEGVKIYAATLEPPIRSGEKRNFTVAVDVLDAFQPLSASVKHLQKPSYKVDALRLFFSPYLTEEQSGEHKFNSPMIILPSQSSADEAKVDGTAVLIGTTKNVDPYTETYIPIWFEETSALLKMDLFEKRISISHWGGAGIKEEVSLRNAGTKVATFSRVDQMHMDRSGMAVNSALSMNFNLPRDAYNVAYKDLIGNITTSNLREPTKRGRHFEQRFRYPLLGGWQIYYWFEYKLPLSSAIKRRGGEYMLRINPQPATTIGIQVDRALIKILLPEGARKIDIKSTDPRVNIVSTEWVYPTLSYFGRKMITLQRSSFLSEPGISAPIYIGYKCSPLNLLRPPLVLSTILFLILSLIMVLSHLDLRLDEDKAQEDSDLALYREVLQLTEVQAGLSALNEEFKLNIKKLSDRSEVANFKQTQNALLERMKTLEADVEAVFSEIVKFESNEQRTSTIVISLLRTKREALAKLSTVAIHLVEGTSTQADAENTADKLNESLASCDQRLDVALSNLMTQL